MRTDIGKVICERERSNSKAPSPKDGISIPWAGPDGDYDQAKRGSMSSGSPERANDNKSFTDVLGPLYRWLDGQVGKPWNKVYSELCQGLDKRKTTHQHVFDHALQYVEVNAFLGEDGQYYVRGRYWMNQAIDGLFVHPKTGLIRRQRRRPEPEKPKKEEFVRLGEGPLGLHAYEKKAGIWYETLTRKATRKEKLLGHSTIMLVKRQLGKRELRDLRRFHLTAPLKKLPQVVK